MMEMIFGDGDDDDYNDDVSSGFNNRTRDLSRVCNKIRPDNYNRPG